MVQITGETPRTRVAAADSDRPGFDESAIADLAAVLAEPARLRLLLLLGQGERNVSELQGVLGVPQPTVSHHLGQLRRFGLVRARREGKRIFYSLARPSPGPGVVRVFTRDGSSAVEVRTAEPKR